MTRRRTRRRRLTICPVAEDDMTIPRWRNAPTDQARVPRLQTQPKGHAGDAGGLDGRAVADRDGQAHADIREREPFPAAGEDRVSRQRPARTTG